jgi:hypothetical protein
MVLMDFLYNQKKVFHAHYFFTRVKNQDFNYTTNPSIIDSNGNLIYTTLNKQSSNIILQLLVYIMTNNELLAVAKLSRPLTKRLYKRSFN